MAGVSFEGVRVGSGLWGGVWVVVDTAARGVGLAGGLGDYVDGAYCVEHGVELVCRWPAGGEVQG